MTPLEDLLEPVSEDAPGGENLRYEPVYDEIKQARHEEPDVPQGEWKRERKVADWAEVEKLATDVLARRSKDLQIAAWLTEAWLRRQGFSGLHQGLELLRRLQEEFWDDVHPELEEEDDLELRAVPLAWVGQYLEPAVDAVRLTEAGHTFFEYRDARRIGYEEEVEDDASRKEAREAAVGDGKLTPEEFDEGFAATHKSWYKELVADVAACRESLEALDTFCEERYGDATPSFLTLREALEEAGRVADRLLARKLEDDPDPPDEEAIESPGSEEASAGGGVGADGAGASGEAAGAPREAAGAPGGGAAPALSAENLGSWDEAARLVAVAAGFMRKERPTDPASYLMLRGLRWGELRGGGESVDPKLLSAPPTSTRTKLKTLLLDEKWEELLEASESVMATAHGRGWLDLQRYVLTALEELGAGYEAVADAVRQALRGLLTQRPELPDLTLMDDSPTANPETRTWLQEEILAGAGGENGGRGEAAPGRKRSRDPYSTAMAHVRAGHPQKGVQLLMREAAQETSARARFLRRSQAAQIMVREGMETVAFPILREMMDQVERHNLEEWEAGDTVARPMALLYRCMDRENGNPQEKEQLYLRICRLDPLQGMSLDAGGLDDAPVETSGDPEDPAEEVDADAGEA